MSVVEMAKKQTKKGEPQDRGLTKMLTVTVVLGVVFSAGLITGDFGGGCDR